MEVEIGMAIYLNKKYEREFVNNMNDKGHLCLRIAGSGAGKEAFCDCILIKNGETYLVEVKATKEKKLANRKHLRDQLDKLKESAKSAKVKALLAIKYKYRGWEIVDLN